MVLSEADSIRGTYSVLDNVSGRLIEVPSLRQ